MSEHQLNRLLTFAKGMSEANGLASVLEMPKPEGSKALDKLAAALNGLSSDALFVLEHASKDFVGRFPRYQPERISTQSAASDRVARIMQTSRLLNAAGISALLRKATELGREYPAVPACRIIGIK